MYVRKSRSESRLVLAPDTSLARHFIPLMRHMVDRQEGLWFLIARIINVCSVVMVTLALYSLSLLFLHWLVLGCWQCGDTGRSMKFRDIALSLRNTFALLSVVVILSSLMICFAFHYVIWFLFWGVPLKMCNGFTYSGYYWHCQRELLTTYAKTYHI